MSKHFNPSIGEDALRILNTKTGDALSPELGKLTPVIPITPIIKDIRRRLENTTGAHTILFTPLGRDYYVVGFQVCMESDVAADNTSYSINGTINGVSQVLFHMLKPTLTADNQNHTIMFPYPIKIDRGTAISHITTFTVGAVDINLNMYGYFEEVAR